MAVAKKGASKKSRRQRALKKQTQPTAARSTSVLQPSSTENIQLSSAWRLMLKGFAQLRSRWAYWLGFIVVLCILNILLVHNFSANTVSIKGQLSAYLGEHNPATGVGTYALLVMSNGSSAPGAAGVYQYLLLIVGSLAAIWSLRQFMANKGAAIRLRDSFYEGMAPLVPFILIMIVLAIELFPLLGTGTLYGIVTSAGVTRTVIEQIMFFAIFVAGAALTLWLVGKTLFALYIVTLPGGRPVQALKDASRLVRGRQLAVTRKILFLLLVLLLVSMAVLLPVIIVAPNAAQIVLVGLTIVALPYVHAYLYSLYRELLG